MERNNEKESDILAISPCSRGFGYAVMRPDGSLTAWGLKIVEKGDKNAGALKKLRRLATDYRPSKIAIEDPRSAGCHRAPRIVELFDSVVAWAKAERLELIALDRDWVQKTFFPDGKGTKHQIAQILAASYADELGHRLPSKRRPWESQHAAMDIFEAVSLAITSIKQEIG